jgi:hypothetical protein
MRRVIGEDAANATLARNVLPAVADKLSGGDDSDPDLHHRCVLFDCAPSRVRADEVCAALAPSGGGGADIEAVALCGYFVAAVVVFRTATDAVTALRGPARWSCHAVPPLDSTRIWYPGVHLHPLIRWRRFKALKFSLNAVYD